MILVGGGARSGKSRFALDLARRLGPRRIFIATGQALDGEMADRIGRHQAERGASFQTVEEPVALADALDQHHRGVDVIVVDCLTLWVSNLLLRSRPDEGADGAGSAPMERVLATAFGELDATLTRCTVPVILVSNEVGLGLVPETPLGRAFRDAIGGLHQRLAAGADEIYAALMGVVLRLHPGPVAVVQPPGAGAPESTAASTGNPTLPREKPAGPFK